MTASTTLKEQKLWHYQTFCMHSKINLTLCTLFALTVNTVACKVYTKTLVEQKGTDLFIET